MPRMKVWFDRPEPEPPCRMVTFGTEAARSMMLVTPRCSSVWPLMAVIEIGVFWTFSARYSAVTTTSETVFWSFAGAARPGEFPGAAWAWAEAAEAA